MGKAVERVLFEGAEGDETRKVSAIFADNVSVIEVTHGTPTMVAYGAHLHGHKVVCTWSVCAGVLGVEEDQVEEALARRFGTGEVLLSDLMDQLDVDGAHYAYMSWTDAGDGALRRG